MSGLLIMMKGLPLAYAKDMQEDQEPTFVAADSLMLAIAATTGLVADLQPRPDRMLAAAAEGFITATDLADWLVRALGLPFRQPHHVACTIVTLADELGPGLPTARMRVSCGKRVVL